MPLSDALRSLFMLHSARFHLFYIVTRFFYAVHADEHIAYTRSRNTNISWLVNAWLGIGGVILQLAQQLR